MQLFYYAILVSAANAVLPPGYEDQIHCPPDECEIYSNHYGHMGGASSSFHKCYNPSTDETIDGVWTGSRTNVTAPDDYIEPELCTALEYSECDTDDDCSLEIESSWCRCYVNSIFHHFDPCAGLDPSACKSYTDQCTDEECNDRQAACVKGSDGMGGTCKIGRIPPPTPVPVATEKIPAQCEHHNQCYTKMRSQVPGSSSAAGVGTCECYAASTSDPFDECEGDNLCATAGCSHDACYGLEADCYINVAFGKSSSSSDASNNTGECELRSLKVA